MEVWVFLTSATGSPFHFSGLQTSLRHTLSILHLSFCPSFTLHWTSLSLQPSLGPPSGPFQVLVFLAKDGHLVLEQHWVQSELGVDQGHVSEPAGEGVDALLTLAKVLWVGPGQTLATLGEEVQEIF